MSMEEGSSHREGVPRARKTPQRPSNAGPLRPIRKSVMCNLPIAANSCCLVYCDCPENLIKFDESL